MSDKISNTKEASSGAMEKVTASKAEKISLTYKGETKTIRDWSKEKSIPEDVLVKRTYLLGWSAEKAIETPLTTEAKMVKELTKEELAKATDLAKKDMEKLDPKSKEYKLLAGKVKLMEDMKAGKLSIRPPGHKTKKRGK
ncbi:MAG: hypothetical protein WC554_07970 [Clostridia bacterium]|jgi:hypothetical protein